MPSAFRRPSSAAILVLAVTLVIAAVVRPAWALDEPLVEHGRLVYPEGADIPRGLTTTERAWLADHPLGDPRATTAPPTGPVHCAAEYEPMEAILLAWESYYPILTTMAYQITTTGDADVWVVVDTAGEQTSAATMLAAGGVVMSRVHFLVRTTDTVWIRDYGPRYIYEGHCRAIVDHVYNRPRPYDDAFPFSFSTEKHHAYYGIPLTHGGGNYHLDANSNSFTSRLVVNENPSLTESRIHDLWKDYQNVDTTFFTPFPTSVDSTQHIDMWMQVVADDRIVISDWPYNSGSTQDQICDNAAAALAARGYTIYRTPARSVGGTHYTYTNVVMCNNLVLIPSYTNSSVTQHNAPALAAWQSACPGKTIVQVNCESMIGAAGAMHCVAMHIPAPRGGLYPTTYLKRLRGGEVLTPGDTADIMWLADDDLAAVNADVWLSTDGGVTFPTLLGTVSANDGLFPWLVPPLYAPHARVRVVVSDADGRTAYDQSDSDVVINGVLGDADGDGNVDLADHAVFATCLFGPGAAPAPDPGPPTVQDCLDYFDFAKDGDVDLGDFAVFQSALR